MALKERCQGSEYRKRKDPHGKESPQLQQLQLSKDPFLIHRLSQILFLFATKKKKVNNVASIDLHKVYTLNNLANHSQESSSLLESFSPKSLSGDKIKKKGEREAAKYQK